MRDVISIIIGIFLTCFFACTDESTDRSDTNISTDLTSDIKIVDVSSKDAIEDIYTDTNLPDSSLSDIETCIVKCPQNMHCENNKCVCDNGFDDCNNDESDGCEADLTSLRTCGECNNDCSQPMLGAEEFACYKGVCVVARCREGRADCNKKGNDGCEVYLNDDPHNCSICGFDCGQNSKCIQGKCECLDGFANCNLLLNDGCEENISSNNDNCGLCGFKCGQNSYCSNKKCICNNGYDDCNNSKADGCETKTYEDKYHCGDCKTNCTELPNVKSVKCDSGSCVIIDCLYGFGNCDNYNPNGCEVNFSSDPKHCGDCATNCGDNSVCNNRVCGCKTDYENCNGLWNDGCEIFLNNDKTCGTDCTNYINCNSNAKCVNHQCECISPYANCNDRWDDGCEINTSNDRLNCGICKSTCVKINYSGSCINSKCAGRYSLAFSYGSTGNDWGGPIAVDPSGNIIVTGNFSDVININGKQLIPEGGSDIFVAKFTSNGTLLNIRSFGSTQDDSIQGIYVNKNGDIIITGFSGQEINFGGGSKPFFGNKDIFIVKLNNKLEHVWTKGFGSDGYDDGISVVVDDDLNIILTGRFSNSMDMDGRQLISKGCTDIFLAKLNNNGSILWAKAFGSAAAATNGCDSPSQITVDKSGNIYMTGGFSIKEDFGGDELTSKGSIDTFLVSFDKNGNHLKSMSLGSPATDIGLGIGINSKNELILSMVYSGTIRINTKDIPSRGDFDILILKYDTDFNFIKSVDFGSTYEDIAIHTIDKDDNIIFTGRSRGPIKFGYETLTNYGDSDIILVKLDSDLNHIFSYTFGSNKYDEGLGITTDQLGNIYISGEISGPVDFGGGEIPYPNFNKLDFFIAKFLP